ncbi:transmembrane protease serine 9-like [Topomyia yanbarensis]|uniref:transmembrane protease serine 9-like n=1 Tax=Topomyia yanbarensis TaxID=2498891 RepID=UPI00273B9FC9|nr:transmembrane protease serine 9-like [Topomyia yanbarensis]
MFSLVVTVTIAIVISSDRFLFTHGSQQATPGQFTYQAFLRKGGDQFVCSAVIIQCQFLLTAAHCTVGEDPHEFQVIVGTIFSTGNNGTAYKVARFIEHDRYNASTNEFDMALIKTSAIIDFNSFVLPAPMNHYINYEWFPNVTVSGWEMLNCSVAEKLQYTEMKVNLLTESTAHQHYGNYLQTTGSSCPIVSNGEPLVNNGFLIGVAGGLPCSIYNTTLFADVSATAHAAWIINAMNIPLKIYSAIIQRGIHKCCDPCPTQRSSV